MKSVFKKSRLFIMLASLLGVVSPMAQAADLVPVQPTVAVVDEQHQAISWANLMLNGFYNIMKARLLMKFLLMLPIQSLH